MSNDFFLLPLVGIFRKDSIESVVPVLEDDFGITTAPPKRANEQFTFTISKTTSANVEIRRGKEALIDPSFKDFVCSLRTYDLDELYSALFTSSSDGKLKEKIALAAANYIRRLEKVEEYEEKLAAIQPLAGTDAYVTQLSFIKDPNTDDEYKAKQAKSLANINSYIISALDDISDKYLGSNEGDADEDEETPSLLDHLDTEENIERINKTVSSVLSSFYQNVLGCYYDDVSGYVDDLSDDKEDSIEADLEAANEILNSENTLRNKVELVDSEEDAISPVEGDSPTENE